MKTKIDSVGRIGIPKKVRLLVHWENDTPLDIRVDTFTEEVILKKAEKNCICCGATESIFHLKNDIYLCSDCAKVKLK